MNTSFYKNLILSTLQRIRIGCLIIKLPDESRQFFGSPENQEPIEWHVHDESMFKDIILGQDIGLGESYIEGKWSCSDLTGLIRLLIDNGGYLKQSKNPWLAALLSKLLLAGERLRHAMRGNTREQSVKNIHAHYDLGNDFYRTFLDSGMAYSSAFFRSKEDSLESAQFEKNDRLCRKLALKPEHHLLEIGSGWGGMAIHAAREFGCRVTTVTISKAQFSYARERIKEAGLEARIDIRFQDYRDIEGKFDRIVSVEMLEAVGHEHLETYFNQCAQLLKPNGIIGIQAILSPDSRYKFYRNRVDYIRKHIFPGGHLPSISSVLEQVRSKTSWDLQHFESFGTHYAETLRRWNEQFKNNQKTTEQLGFDEAFARKWEFYLCYCEAGFDARHIQVGQFIFCAPNNQDLNVEHALEIHTDKPLQKASQA